MEHFFTGTNAKKWTVMLTAMKHKKLKIKINNKKIHIYVRIDIKYTILYAQAHRKKLI